MGRRLLLTRNRVNCINRTAKDLKIAAYTPAPRAALEAIARSRARTLDQIMASGGLLRWQAELVQAAVEKLRTQPGKKARHENKGVGTVRVSRHGSP